MSTTYIAIIANILAQLLPKIGVTVGTDSLTSTIQVIVAIVSGLWVMYKRTTLQKSPTGVGDVTALGVRKV